MTQERIEAAAVVLCEQLWENAHESQREYAREEATEALAAADEVMFSEAMHAKVAQVLWESEGCTWQVQASKVFTALKDDA